MSVSYPSIAVQANVHLRRSRVQKMNRLLFLISSNRTERKKGPRNNF